MDEDDYKKNEKKKKDSYSKLLKLQFRQTDKVRVSSDN